MAEATDNINSDPMGPGGPASGESNAPVSKPDVSKIQPLGEFRYLEPDRPPIRYKYIGITMNEPRLYPITESLKLDEKQIAEARKKYYSELWNLRKDLSPDGDKINLEPTLKKLGEQTEAVLDITHFLGGVKEPTFSMLENWLGPKEPTAATSGAEAGPTQPAEAPKLNMRDEETIQKLKSLFNPVENSDQTPEPLTVGYGEKDVKPLKPAQVQNAIREWFYDNKPKLEPTDAPIDWKDIGERLAAEMEARFLIGQIIPQDFQIRDGIESLYEPKDGYPPVKFNLNKPTGQTSSTDNPPTSKSPGENK